MKNIIVEAAQFAKFCHAPQLRKYTNKPYITHPGRVASMVSYLYPAVSEEMIAAAWLHDTVEDCNVWVSDIELKFGKPVATLVHELTNVSKKEFPKANRAERKRMDLDRVAGISLDAQVIKVCDRVDNLLECPVEIEEAKNFMVDTYFEESTKLLEEALKSVDAKLDNILKQTLESVREKFFT